MAMTMTTIRLSDELLMEARTLAEKTGKGMSEIIRDLLRAEIAAHRDYDNGRGKDRRILKV